MRITEVMIEELLKNLGFDLSVMPPETRKTMMGGGFKAVQAMIASEKDYVMVPKEPDWDWFERAFPPAPGLATVTDPKRKAAGEWVHKNAQDNRMADYRTLIDKMEWGDK